MMRLLFIPLIMSFICVQPLYSQDAAGTIYTNGKIITVDAAFSIQQAIAVKGSRILAVGSTADLQRYRTAQTKIVDLDGKTVMPGLIDSHVHAAAASAVEFDHPIPDMDSISDVLAYIRERTKVLEKGEWIWIAQVFLTRLQEGRYPTKAELDSAAPNHPVVFRTGPDASVNSLALTKSGITKGWKVDDGGPGYIETDPQTGEPTGILRGCTRYLKYNSPLKEPSQNDRINQLKKLMANYNSVGITGIAERSSNENHIDLYRTLRDQNGLSVRVYLSFHVNTIAPVPQIEKQIASITKMPEYEPNDWFNVRAVKLFMDGGMLTGSAYMREPWGISDFYNIQDPEYRGIRNIPEDVFESIVEACMKHKIQLTAHCVGDAAVHAFIDGCRSVSEKYDIRQHRPVICHCNFMTPEAINQMAELGINADLQPAWLHLDSRTLLQQFGYDRMTWFQPLRTIFEQGVIAGGGSDHMQKIGSLRSINFYDPWKGMWVAMSRNAKWVDQPIHEEQALSRVEAIRFYTINNAYILFDDEDRGSLEAGKLADFIVLDQDILTCELDDVPNTKVFETYVGGKQVYAKQ